MKFCEVLFLEVLFYKVLFCDEVGSVMKFGSVMKLCSVIQFYAVQFCLEVHVSGGMFCGVLFGDEVLFYDELSV